MFFSRVTRILALLRERTLFRLTITTMFIATVLTVLIGVPAGYLSWLDAAPLVALALGMCVPVTMYYFAQRGE